MHLRPSLTFDQYFATVQAIQANRRKKKSSWPSVLFGFAIGLVIAFLYTLDATRPAGMILFVLLLLYWFGGKRYFRRRYKAALRISYEDQAPILNGQQMEITQDGISGSWVGGKATYSYTWQAFYTFLDRTDALLFLYAPCCWVRVPKDQLTPDELALVENWYRTAQGQSS